MENIDVLVLRTLRDWRRGGQRAMLATVVRTWGSSPRPVGSIMALCESGAVVGSVSGGCVEDDLIYRFSKAYQKASHTGEPHKGEPHKGDLHGGELHLGDLTSDMPSGAPQRVKYGISADEAHRFGLPCGGTLELVLEFDPDTDALDQLIAHLEAGRLVARHTDLRDGRVSLTPLETPTLLRIDEHRLTNTFGPEYRMLIIGAGQLSEYLCTMALFCGFAVTVCDPREEYTGAWSVPQARLTSEMPDDAARAFRADHRSCVIALTHDPKLDDLALLEALESNAFYIGAIGSRRNNQARRQRLIEHFGQSTESLARLRGPIGVYIGSKTPPEIAVSVMAEVLAAKNGLALPPMMQVGPAKEQQQIDSHDSDHLVCGVV